MFLLGDIVIQGGLTLTVDSDLNGASPQFSLTCNSTGGPATTVTWTREPVRYLRGSTVLNDATTAQYTHTLTVTGREFEEGHYTCTVFNDKPSTATASYTIEGTSTVESTYGVVLVNIIPHITVIISPVASAPTRLMVVQEGLTSIQVSWSPPTPLGTTTGYRIYYSGGSSGSEDVSGGSTDNYLLTDLLKDTSYTISIVGTSQHFFSDDRSRGITLSECLHNYRLVLVIY